MADLADRMRVLTKHYDLPNEASEALLGGAAEIEVLRTTLARLTADLAAVTAERDMWRGECASISAELDLPPGMRPMEGELRRMLGHNRALLAQVTTLTAERDEARGMLDASDTTRREWEVRAATSYAAGRAAGLREAAAKLAELRDEWEVMMGDGSVAHNCGKIAHGHVIALAPPVAETVPHDGDAYDLWGPGKPAAEPRDEGEVSGE